MHVADVMTRDVRTVCPDLPLKDVALVMSRQGISGIPVVDAENRVLGVVSEADIVRMEQGFSAERGGVLDWLRGSGKPDPRDEARTAGEAMTTPAVTIEPGRPVSEAARLMVKKGISRLPVVQMGRLIGIVTRDDLVRVFSRPDEEIEREIVHDVLFQTLWIAPARVAVEVSQGEVSLRGAVETRTEAELVAAYVRRVPGVVGVRSELTWSEDDLALRRGIRARATPASRAHRWAGH